MYLYIRARERVNINVLKLYDMVSDILKYIYIIIYIYIHTPT